MDSELDPLLERSRRGDPTAWASLVGRLEAHVYSVARRLGLGGEDAADVFLAVFEALHRNLDKIPGGRTLPKWLATAAARESYRIIHLQNLAAEVPLDELIEFEDRNAEAEAVKAAEAFQVQSALARIGTRCQGLLEALYMEDAPYAEVTARLGIPQGAIGPSRARCLERLRQTLADEGFFD